MSGHNQLQEQFLSDFLETDPGDGEAIAPSKDRAMFEIKTSAAETRTLSDPETAGIELSLAFEEDGGDCTITADTAVNQTGNNTIVLADVGDVIKFLSIPDGSGGYAWRVVANDGAALSTV